MNIHRGYGHATAMLTDRSVKVGCAVCQYVYTRKGKAMNATEVACNYASTNVMGANVWKVGETGSLCKTGRNPTYGNLCHPKEGAVRDWNEVTVGV